MNLFRNVPAPVGDRQCRLNRQDNHQLASRVGLVLFLASDKGAFIAGSELVVDGGRANCVLR